MATEKVRRNSTPGWKGRKLVTGDDATSSTNSLALPPIDEDEDDKEESRAGPNDVNNQNGLEMRRKKNKVYLEKSNTWISTNLKDNRKQQERRISLTKIKSYRQCRSIYLAKATTIVTFSAVMVVLFFNDVFRVFNINDSFTWTGYIVPLMACAILVVDIILSSFYMPNYVLGFYFWADIAGTLSIFLDLPYMYEGPVTFPVESSLLRTTRIARFGKILRVQRVVRSVRLIRIMRLLKIKVFSDSISKGTATSLILLVMVAPFLTYTNMYPNDSDATFFYSVENIVQACPSASQNMSLLGDDFSMLDHFVQLAFQSGGMIADDIVLRSVRIFNNTWVNPAAGEVQQTANLNVWESINITITFDCTLKSQIESAFNISMIMFLILTLAILSIYVHHRVQILMVKPIGSIFHIINEVLPGVFPNSSVGAEAASKTERDITLAEEMEHIDELSILVQKLTRIAEMTDIQKMITNDLRNADSVTREFIKRQYSLGDLSSESWKTGDQQQSIQKWSNKTVGQSRTQSLVQYQQQAAQILREMKMETRVQLDELRSLSFCPYTYDMPKLLTLPLLMLRSQDFLEEYKINNQIATDFVHKVSSTVNFFTSTVSRHGDTMSHCFTGSKGLS